jgi:pimeloyl-ACP methyl ester carboxylesterase
VTEQIARANGIELAYDTFGDPDDPSLLLIMGLGMQMIAWDPEFCGLLVERGFHIVRFDNRDVGHSTKIEHGPRPNPLQGMLGMTGSASYTLDDMADDACGLLDHLGLEHAHVAGASLGGMIAQALAVRHPNRVASLCSIMSTTGNRWVAIPRWGAFTTLMRRSPNEREAYADWAVETFKVIGSPGFKYDAERIRRRSEASFDRGRYPIGIARQLLAISASGDRTSALRKLRVPTLVLHGAEDPLIPARAGRATARAIPGAKLVEFPGMGHDLPRELWPQIADEIAANAARAGAPAAKAKEAAS